MQYHVMQAAVTMAGAFVFAVWKWYRNAVNKGESFSVPHLLHGVIVGGGVAAMAGAAQLGIPTHGVSSALGVAVGYAGSDVANGAVRQIESYFGLYQQKSGSSPSSSSSGN